MGPLGELVTGYLDAVVNRHELVMVDELVAPDYRGTGRGWPADRDALRAFYAWQYAERADWRIVVQETVEVDDCVVVRAHAGGTVESGRRREVEWLAAYRVRSGRVVEVHVLALRDLS